MGNTPFWPNSLYQIGRVESAGFIDSDTLFAKTNFCRGDWLFVLNISAKNWKVSEKLVESYEFPGFGIKAVVNGELCFDPYYVIDINHMSRRLSVCGVIPPSFEDLGDYKDARYSCTVDIDIDREKKERRKKKKVKYSPGCKLYTVFIARERKTKNVKFVVCGYWVDIDKYNEDKKELEVTWRSEIRIEEDNHELRMRQLMENYDKIGEIESLDEDIKYNHKMVGKMSLNEHIKFLEFILHGCYVGKLRQKWQGHPDINMNLTTSSLLKLNSLKFQGYGNCGIVIVFDFSSSIRQHLLPW